MGRARHFLCTPSSCEDVDRVVSFAAAALESEPGAHGRGGSATASAWVSSPGRHPFSRPG